MARPQLSHLRMPLSRQGLGVRLGFACFGARKPSSFFARWYSRLLMMAGWASSTRTGG